jgi:hypothetical protein
VRCGAVAAWGCAPWVCGRVSKEYDRTWWWWALVCGREGMGVGGGWYMGVEGRDMWFWWLGGAGARVGPEWG